MQIFAFSNFALIIINAYVSTIDPKILLSSIVSIAIRASYNKETHFAAN
jgi:hypothetical protein